MKNNKNVFYDKIKYLVIDVDGTMTDGGIYYDDNGNEFKKFNTRDAAGFFAAKENGIEVIVLTGRKCEATARRMKELKVNYIYQGVTNKTQFLDAHMKENRITIEEIGYLGDDLNDFSAMKLVSFVGCPKDSCEEILEIADYISSKNGGEGAVRDIISYILKERGQWKKAVDKIYNINI